MFLVQIINGDKVNQFKVEVPEDTALEDELCEAITALVKDLLDSCKRDKGGRK